jgi:hypothetical protein
VNPVEDAKLMSTMENKLPEMVDKKGCEGNKASRPGAMLSKQMPRFYQVRRRRPLSTSSFLPSQPALIDIDIAHQNSIYLGRYWDARVSKAVSWLSHDQAAHVRLLIWIHPSARYYISLSHALTGGYTPL